MKNLSKSNKDIKNNIILVIICVNFLATLFFKLYSLEELNSTI